MTDTLSTVDSRFLASRETSAAQGLSHCQSSSINHPAITAVLASRRAAVVDDHECTTRTRGAAILVCSATAPGRGQRHDIVARLDAHAAVNVAVPAAAAATSCCCRQAGSTPAATRFAACRQ